MNETTKINFNNADGSFNRDKWLDFMNTKIQSIGFYSAWTGHTAKIVNQQTKKISWADSSCNIGKFVSKAPRHTVYYKWNINEGWTHSVSPSKYINNPTDKIEIFKESADFHTHFVVVYPNGQWRYLGYWEYAQYGLKKYIPFKVQDQLKKLGVL